MPTPKKKKSKIQYQDEAEKKEARAAYMRKRRARLTELRDQRRAMIEKVAEDAAKQLEIGLRQIRQVVEDGLARIEEKIANTNIQPSITLTRGEYLTPAPVIYPITIDPCPGKEVVVSEDGMLQVQPKSLFSPDTHTDSPAGGD